MFYFTDRVLLLPYALAALSGGLNAAYFWSYRSQLKRRRIGALALFLVNAGIASEGLLLTALALVRGQNEDWMSPVAPALWLAVRLLVCLGALSVTELILRRVLAKRG